MSLFFRKIERQRKHLSSSETQVYEYLLKQPAIFLKQDISQIAQSGYVSTATVSRTVKKLGYHNLTEFKIYLQEALQGEQPEQVTKANFLEHSAAIQQVTRADLDLAKVHRVTTAIHSAHHIEFLGLGPSYTVAVDGARRLIFAGKNASNRSEWDEIDRVVNTIDPNDLVFLISCSGETPVMGGYAETLYRRQVNTIGIIGSFNSSLAKKVGVAFEVQIPNISYHDIDLSTRIPLLQMVEIIIDEYIYQYKL